MAAASLHCQPGLPLAGDKLGGSSADNYGGCMPSPDKDRAQRLAAALRENLRKRKAQVREMNPRDAAAQKKDATQPAKE